MGRQSYSRKTSLRPQSPRNSVNSAQNCARLDVSAAAGSVQGSVQGLYGARPSLKRTRLAGNFAFKREFTGKFALNRSRVARNATAQPRNTVALQRYSRLPANGNSAVGVRECSSADRESLLASNVRWDLNDRSPKWLIRTMAGAFKIAQPCSALCAQRAYSVTPIDARRTYTMGCLFMRAERIYSALQLTL